MKKSTKLILALLALGALAVGGFLVWFYVVKDDADPVLSNADLDSALQCGTAGAGATLTEAAGSWTMSTTCPSTVGYRVSEVLSGLDTVANGRGHEVTGTMTIEGATVTAASFEVAVESITSDSDRRDGQFTRIMSTNQFPTATFVLTAPIELAATPAEGTTVAATATGDLTLRGFTNRVTFTLQAKLVGGRIGVLGNIAILFSDYEIPDPSNSIATVKDNGLLEFVLVFDKSA